MIPRRALLAAAAALALPGCARAVPLPPGATRLDLRDDRIFVDVTVNGVATAAILDSAAEMTVLDRAFAAPLGLRGGEAVTARGTGRATTAATLVRGATIAVAGLTLTPATVALIDLGELAARIGAGRIDVILGRDLFDAGRLALDLDGGALRVMADRDPPGIALPLTPRRGIETVPVTIEGVPAAADFDLGNGGTVLVGAAFAARHGLLAGRATGVIPGGGIGGATQQTTFTLASLDLAGHRFTGVPVAIDASPSAADANLGVRLLRRFAMVTDFPGARVWLEFRG